MFIFNLHCQLDLVFRDICYIKTSPNLKFPLYLKKAGLASRNSVHSQKNILRPVGFCLYILHFTCQEDSITIDRKYTSRIIVPVACLNISCNNHDWMCSEGLEKNP